MNQTGQRAQHRPRLQQEARPSAAHSSLRHLGFHSLSPAEAVTEAQPPWQSWWPSFSQPPPDASLMGPRVLGESSLNPPV